MSPQHRYMLQVGMTERKFVPAKLVKELRKYPNDYRKRLSEMLRLGLVEKLDEKVDRFAVWTVTKLGRKSIK